MSHLFQAKKIEYEGFIESPSEIIGDSRLVIRIDKRLYYDWRSAAPILMSYLVFKAPLPPNVVD